jgi:UPF0755 protein
VLCAAIFGIGLPGAPRRQKALQNQHRRHLVHHFAMLGPRTPGGVQMPVGLGGREPLVPQVHRQAELLPHPGPKGLRFQRLGAHIARHIQRIAHHNLSAAKAAQQAAKRLHILLAIAAHQREHGLRRQPQLIAHGHAYAAVAHIEGHDAALSSGVLGWLGHTASLERMPTSFALFAPYTPGRESNQITIQRVIPLRKFFSLLLFVVLAAAGYAAYVALVPEGPSSPVLVTIAPGTPTLGIGRQLEQKGLIRSRWALEAMHLAKGGTLKAGVYRFDHPATLSEVFGRLRRGDVYTISVTIPEGSNIFDIAHRLAQKKLATEQGFLAVAEHDTQLISDLDPQAPSLEGYLFPDTYKITPGTAPEAIAATMVAQFRVEAAKLGLGKATVFPSPDADQQTSPETGADPASVADASSASASQAPRSLHEIVTIASLVERETPIPSERPLVASVFYNRLAQQMPLMTDPSVIYAALLQNHYRGAIYESDLKSDSPYNTYTHAGLPPGPVCNPGLASLRAAMHPAQTNYLYFVAASADPSGHSRFSATLAQHDKNVQAYRRAVRQAQRR